MSTMKTRFHAFAAGILAGSIPLCSLMADDTEIYVRGNSAFGGVPPNILFIIDTSGSMDGLVEVNQEPYNPSITYAGSCQSDRVYWDDDPRYPGCNTSQYIELDKFNCQAAKNAFETAGYFQDRFASWRDGSGTRWDYWTDVRSRYNSRLTDCKADSGSHGNGGTETYAADGADGPWNDTASKSIDWDSMDVVTFMSGNYLNWYNNPPTQEKVTRLEVVQSVTKDLLDSVANVNFGLMRYSSDADGGMIMYPVKDVAEGRDLMKAQIDALKPLGGTPLSESYYEAIQYYRGSDVDFGLDSKVSTLAVPSTPLSRGNGDDDLNDANDDTYISPIQYQCQKNFIIYLTDGEPTSDSQAGAKIKAWPGYAGIGECHDSISGDCLEEAAAYAYKRDIMPSLAGDQNVITYVVGFNIEVDKLTDTAKAGGGKFFLANDSKSLLEAFTSIVTEILAINTTFTAPAVSVNAFNRTVHLDQLFFTVFKPSDKPHWNGNLKRFDLGFQTGSTDLKILDVNGNPAVDPNTGFFAETATSFWTNSDQAPDGGEAALGGAAGELTVPRNVYTYLGTNSNLADSSNAVNENNTALTKSILGIDLETDAYRNVLLQWARGVDVNDEDDDGSTTDARRIMGDPLHSKPVVVTYGGDIDNPDFTVYMSTNDGYLHAINAVTGEELFSFVPKDHLDNLNVLYQNAANQDKNYGLDNPITAWVKDDNRNGIIETPDDHVYIYIGERRGGQAYYALDVTDRSAPKFLWRIDNNDSGFEELGQTWSQPRFAKIRTNTGDKSVLIFGGGYDPDQDHVDIYAEDDQGRAIYIVDAETGALIWSAGPTSSTTAKLKLTDMKNSIPSELRVIDMNSDGYADRIYVGDMGGRIFRFDIANGNSPANLVTGGKIASLGAADMATPTEDATRRFYYPPDVALIVDKINGNFLNIAIGSGYRAHPLKATTTDRFFAIRDTNIYNVPSDYAYGITEANLYDATANVIGEGSDADRSAAITLLENSNGWYINLVNISSGAKEGEKVLATATTLDNQIFFTTFTPVSTGSSNNCAPSQGLARAYVVNAATAEPVRNLDEYGTDDDLARSDRSVNLVRGGIPPEVTILFPEANDGKPIGLVGPEELPVGLSNDPVRTYWIQEDTE